MPARRQATSRKAPMPRAVRSLFLTSSLSTVGLPPTGIPSGRIRLLRSDMTRLIYGGSGYTTRYPFPLGRVPACAHRRRA